MKIFGYLKLCDLVTLLNSLSGLLVIIFSIQGDYLIAALFLFIAVIFDTLDGKISRYFNRSSEFGKELDSLADVLSFGIAPIIFVHSFIEQSTFIIIAYALFLVAGILRLARFNLTNMKYFEGMPITLNGIIFPLLFLLQTPFRMYPYIFLLLGFLMISDIKIKKLFVAK